MASDLHLTGFRFNIAAAMFFVRPFHVVVTELRRVRSLGTVCLGRGTFVCLTLSRLTHPIETIRSNILLRVLRPSRWRPYSSAFSPGHSVLISSTEVPSIMIAWGLVTTLTCLVKSYHGLLV